MFSVVLDLWDVIFYHLGIVFVFSYCFVFFLNADDDDFKVIFAIHL